MWHFCVCRVYINRTRVQRRLTYWKKLALKFLIFPSNFKISFVVIFNIWPCCTHSNRSSFTKKWSGTFQWDTSVGLRIVGAGVPMTPISFNVLMAMSLRSMKCGAWVWTGSLAKFILQRKYRSLVEPLESLWPITLLKMDAESRSLGNIISMTASYFWVFPPKPGGVNFRFFVTCRLPLRPQGG